MAKPFQALLLSDYTIAIITAHVPSQHMWPCPGPGLYSKCFKKRGSQILIKQCKSKITDDEIQEEENENTAIYKSTCQCTDRLSATPNGQGAAASSSIPLGLKNFQPP